MASISRKSTNKVPIIILQMLLAGRRAHKNKGFFMGSRVFLWARIMGSQNVMGSDYGSNISDAIEFVIETSVKLGLEMQTLSIFLLSANWW